LFFRLHKNTSDLSDEELIQLYLSKGDSHYAGELYQRYTHLVLGSCMKYFKNEDESEDAVMDIFEKLLEDLKNHEVKNFKSWLYTVTRNHCLMALRKQKQTGKGEEELKIIEENSVESAEPMHLNNKEQKEAELSGLENAITKLSDEQRECIELFYLQEKCYQEVSEITSYSLKEVKSYIQNGKRNLKNLLTTT